MDERKKLLEKANKAIDDCNYKVDATGIPICRLNVAPCDSVINTGKCAILMELFSGEKKGLF